MTALPLVLSDCSSTIWLQRGSALFYLKTELFHQPAVTAGPATLSAHSRESGNPALDPRFRGGERM